MFLCPLGSILCCFPPHPLISFISSYFLSPSFSHFSVSLLSSLSYPFLSLFPSSLALPYISLVFRAGGPVGWHTLVLLRHIPTQLCLAMGPSDGSEGPRVYLSQSKNKHCFFRLASDVQASCDTMSEKRILLMSISEISCSLSLYTCIADRGRESMCASKHVLNTSYRQLIYIY